MCAHFWKSSWLFHIFYWLNLVAPSCIGKVWRFPTLVTIKLFYITEFTLDRPWNWFLYLIIERSHSLIQFFWTSKVVELSSNPLKTSQMHRQTNITSDYSILKKPHFKAPTTYLKVVNVQKKKKKEKSNKHTLKRHSFKFKNNVDFRVHECG